MHIFLLQAVSKSLKAREKTHSKPAHFLKSKNRKTLLFTSLLLKIFDFTFCSFAQKSCKHLPPLKKYTEQMQFFPTPFPFLSPASAACYYASSSKSLYSKILASYTVVHLIHVLFGWEQKGKVLSRGEHDWNCKWFSKCMVMLLRLRFCTCPFQSLLRKLYLIKCRWLAINTVQD